MKVFGINTEGATCQLDAEEGFVCVKITEAEKKEMQEMPPGHIFFLSFPADLPKEKVQEYLEWSKNVLGPGVSCTSGNVSP